MPSTLKKTTETFTLPDGRQLILLSDQTYRLTNINGQHVLYGRAERVEYAESLESERAKQRSAA